MRFQPSHTVNNRPRVSARQISACIERFEKTGESSHSTMGLLLAPLLNHCVKNGIAFTLWFVPHGGYTVKRGSIFPGSDRRSR